MPMYDYYCPTCEEFDETFEHHAVVDLHCPKCNSSAFKVLGGLTVIGITPSKPLEIKSRGVRFDSESDFKRWQKVNPEPLIFPGTQKMKEVQEYARDESDTIARRIGFNNIEDYQRFQRGRLKEQARGYRDRYEK